MGEALEVLLVEDNEGDVELTRQAFRGSRSHCNISVANDGVEAMDFLRGRRNSANAPMPQLILLDLNMPRMGGKEFLEAVKADAQLKAIPVVMLTSSESPDDIRGCYERHASCYIVKPFNGTKFEDAVRQIVHFWNGLGRLPS